MAISPDIESGPFIGNGAQTAFTFSFTAITPAEVAVELDGVAQPAGFTVTLADVGGTVTFASPPAAGVLVMLRSSPDYLQDSVFENEGAYNLATVNTINRRQTVRALVTADRARRAIKAPGGDVADMTLPSAADRADRLLGFGPADSGAKPVVFDVSASAIATLAASESQIALVAASVENIDIVAEDHDALNVVADGHAALNNVADDLANINAVAGDLANINQVAADRASLIAVANDLTNIDLAAANLSAINAAVLAAAASGVFPATANVGGNIPKGAVSTNVTAGTGGTNATNVVATFSGGTLTFNPSILYDIVGGVITNVRTLFRGLYIGAGTPTMPTISNAGLGTNTITLTAGLFYAVGQNYWAVSPDGLTLDNIVNTAGAPASNSANVPSLYLKAGDDAAIAAAIAPINKALTNFSATGETIGIAPAADTAGPTNALAFINTASTCDSTLDSFKASVRTVGNGTARLAIVLNVYGTNKVQVIGDVNLTGIASTGVKTFTAGADFNLLDANGQPIVWPAGSRFALGSATGGVAFDTQVSTGAGFNIAANAGGYNTTQSTGLNWIGKFQVTLGRVKSVRAAIDATANLPVAVPGESFVTEYNGPDSLLFDAIGDQTKNFQFGNGFGFYNDGKCTGMQYCSVNAGTGICAVFRGGVIVDWRLVTIALGDRLTVGFSAPIPHLAGDHLQYIPITAYLKSQNWSPQPGLFPQTNGSWAGGAFVSTNAQPAMRAITVRARKPRKIAAASSRGSTLTLDQRFRGVTLPGNTTFTATTTNGSYQLTGITGTPIVGSFIAGTGLTAAALPFVMSVSGNTAMMSQPATASGTITVTQTGWFSAGTGTWTCNDGLVSPGSVGSPAATDWARRYMFPVPINAQRRTFTAAIYVGDLTNIGGLCSDSQQGSTVTYMGSYIHIDAPANTFRLYQSGANNGLVPPNAGLSVACPWTLAATDWVIVTSQIDRGKQTVTFTNAKTGQSAQIVSTISRGSVAAPVHGGVFSGKPGAHFLQGNGGMKWDYMRNYTHVSSRGPRKFWCHDSTCHLTSDNYNYNWANRVEDQRGKGDFVNCAKAGQTALGFLSTLPQDFLALNPGPGDEVLYGLGVNVDNTNGTSDAQRFSAWQTSTQYALNVFNQAGVATTLITPTPSNALTGYVPLVINAVIGGTLGNIPYIDVGRAVSPLGDGATWTPLYSQDGLHPFETTGAPFIAANFLAQRPDMNGDI